VSACARFGGCEAAQGQNAANRQKAPAAVTSL
jgi:hypothetical protein